MDDHGQDHDADRERVARDAAVRSLVANLIGLGLQLGLIVAISKRDWIKQQAIRYRWYVLREWRDAHERRLLAELRHDLSRIEHGHPGPAGRGGRGLYGGLTGGD